MYLDEQTSQTFFIGSFFTGICMSEMGLSALSSDLVYFIDSSHYVFFGYRERKVLGGLGSYAGSCSNSLDLLVDDIGDTKVSKLGGKTNGLAEVEYLVELFGRCFLQNELAESAVSNLFTVEHAVCLGNLRESVVDGVSCSQSAALESDTA